jgi:hypothetical protein
VSSPLVDWPDSASYVCGSFVTPCHSCGHAYERARAEASLSRLRCYDTLLRALMLTLPPGSDRSAVADALEAVGPLPEQKP